MPFTVFARARPIRSAFILAEGAGSDAACDSLARWSTEVWGGRQTAVVVLGQDGSLSDEAWLELAEFDPDQVHSFAPIPDPLLARLDEFLAPWLITQPKHTSEIEEVDPKPGPQDKIDLPTSGVWQLEHIGLPGVLIPPTKQNLGVLQNRPLLLFLFGKNCPLALRQFLHRNLGSFEQWFQPRTGEPRLIGWMDQAVSGSPVENLRVDHMASACSAMERISGTAPGPNWKPALPCIVPCELSSIHLLRPFSRGVLNFTYCLVVGSTVRDFALYWRICMNEGDGAWDAPFRHCLWIPTEIIQEEAFVAALKNWLYCFTGQGSSGSRSVEITSASLAQEQLSPLGEKLNSGPFVLHIRFAKEGDIAARWRNERARNSAPRRFMPLLDGDNAERLVAVERAQAWELRPAPVIQEEVPTGTWAVDVQIEREQREGGLAGQDWWVLPRRSGRSLVTTIFHGPARISRSGLFAVQVERGAHWPRVETSPRLQFHLPADKDVLRGVLLRSRDRWFGTRDTRHGRLRAEPVIMDVAISDAGRKLRGLIDLFGGFWRAQDYWARPFWKMVFSQMSGRGTRSDAALRTQVEGSVEKELQRLTRGGQRTERQGAARRIAQRILGVVGERMPGVAMTFAEMELERDWLELRHGYEKQVGLAGGSEYPFGDGVGLTTGVRPVTKQELNQGLEELVELGVLAMGANLVCSRCRFKDWVPVDELRQLNKCPGCSSPVPLVPETSWGYRLNPLVRRCVNSRVLAVWLALAEMAKYPGSFFFAPSSELHFAKPIRGSTEKELDLLCVVDSELLVGEVKEGDLHQADFSDFAEIVKVVRPDRAVMFVAEEQLTARARHWFEQFNKQLALSAIRGGLFCLPAY